MRTGGRTDNKTTLIVAFSDFAKALLRMLLTLFKIFALFSPSKASSPLKTALTNFFVMKVQFVLFQIQTTLLNMNYTNCCHHRVKRSTSRKKVHSSKDTFMK